MTTFISEGFEGQWDQVSYQMPTVDELLNVDHMVFCTSEFVTIQHFPDKLTWVTTHWGKFLITRIQSESVDLTILYCQYI